MVGSLMDRREGKSILFILMSDKGIEILKEIQRTGEALSEGLNGQEKFLFLNIGAMV